jgi:ribulose-5-phosphate 4-epimerase/fuculose-1-phosphate aldolase
MDELQARKLIIEVGKLLYERSYVVSSDGNISIRLDENRILATPTMTCKGRMTEDGLTLKPSATRIRRTERHFRLPVWRLTRRFCRKLF